MKHMPCEKLTLNHVPSIALTGEDSPQRREAISKLRSGEINYIITVKSI